MGYPSKPIIRTLRIKKVYFDRIRSGEKTREFRDYKDFYKRLLENPRPDFLILHYQGREKIIVEVKKIKVIKTPERLSESKIRFSDKVYEISLGRVKNIL